VVVVAAAVQFFNLFFRFFRMMLKIMEKQIVQESRSFRHP